MKSEPENLHNNALLSIFVASKNNVNRKKH